MKPTSSLEHLEIEGCRLEFVRNGEAGDLGQPTLVLLHEGLGCTESWRDFPEKLAQRTGLPVLAYSRAGYGGSGPAALPRQPDWMHHEAMVVLPGLLERLDISSTVLIGHSDGASIGIIYTGSEVKGNVKGLVLMAPHVFLEAISLDGVNKARRLYQSADLRERLVGYHGKQVDDAFWSWNDFWRHPAVQGWNIESFLHHIDVPTLIIQGVNDEYGSVAQLDAIESQVSGPVERFVLDEVGHSPHREQPQFVLDKISRFVELS